MNISRKSKNPKAGLIPYLPLETSNGGFHCRNVHGSALQAVLCAIEIQRTLSHRNAPTPPERMIRLRIGIHLGDVVVSDGQVYGDGVNIAARLEPLAQPGGICLSNKCTTRCTLSLDLPLETIGKPSLKNIQTPIEVYRIVLLWERETPAPTRPAAGPPVQDRSSIAVLPPANLSPNPKNEYFSDCLTEDILTNLAKVQRLKVISRIQCSKIARVPYGVTDGI